MGTSYGYTQTHTSAAAMKFTPVLVLSALLCTLATCINVMPPADFDVSYANLNADGSCWRMTHLAKKTDTPGRFSFRSHTWNNENDMRVVDAVYDSYAMVHTIKTMAGVPEVMNKLYSRSPEVSAALQDKFVQFGLDTGVLSDNIVILPKSAECA